MVLAYEIRDGFLSLVIYYTTSPVLKFTLLLDDSLWILIITRISLCSGKGDDDTKHSPYHQSNQQCMKGPPNTRTRRSGLLTVTEKPPGKLSPLVTPVEWLISNLNPNRPTSVEILVRKFTLFMLMLTLPVYVDDSECCEIDIGINDMSIYGKSKLLVWSTNRVVLSLVLFPDLKRQCTLIYYFVHTVEFYLQHDGVELKFSFSYFIF